MDSGAIRFHIYRPCVGFSAKISRFGNYAVDRGLVDNYGLAIYYFSHFIDKINNRFIIKMTISCIDYIGYTS